ncbi:hypothetical protein JMJ77_0004406, partial [Colletotrichum scovillei]
KVAALARTSQPTASAPLSAAPPAGSRKTVGLCYRTAPGFSLFLSLESQYQYPHLHHPESGGGGREGGGGNRDK